MQRADYAEHKIACMQAIERHGTFAETVTAMMDMCSDDSRVRSAILDVDPVRLEDLGLSVSTSRLDAINGLIMLDEDARAVKVLDVRKGTVKGMAA